MSVRLCLSVIIPPLQWSWRGGILVSPCPSVCPSIRPSVSLWTESCPLCIFHDTSRFHFIFTHLINQLQKLCRMLRFLKSLKFWQFIWNCNFDFVLCLCNINVDSWPKFLLQPQFSMMIPLDGLLNISSGLGQNCKFLFFTICFHSAFHLVFVVATTNLSFYCSHFEWPEIWHADVSWPLQNWLDFGHHLLIFLILASFWLSETGQICNRTFSGERKGGMAWTLACRCILITFQTY